MKILYFVNGLNFKGGIARIVVDKVNYLAERDGHEMTICTLNNSTQSFYPLSDKVQLIPFGGEKNEQDSVVGKLRKLVSMPKRVKNFINRGGVPISRKCTDSVSYMGVALRLQGHSQDYGNPFLSFRDVMQH